MMPEMVSQRVKIVVIEDDPDDVLLVRDYLSDLRMLSAMITVCNTYQQGWEQITADTADVYLIDQHLGAEKGVSLISRARDRGIQKPMILLTGNDSPEVDYEAQQAGASDYVFKGDLKPSLLERAIRYSLAQWQALEARERYIQERLARRQAQQLERRKTDFLRIASHELKTPITSALSNLYLLKEEIEAGHSAEAQSYADRMHRQLKQLTGMVEDLLDLSKIEMEKLHYHPEIINVSELTEEVIQDISPTTAHTITFNKLSKDVFIKADPARLKQVLTNLLSNAVKYSPEADTVKVTLAATETTVTISVTDFGMGIPEEELEHIFGNFFSSSYARMQQNTGLGLGLYLAKHIVSLHGGTIGVESEVGSGSTFTVDLPYEK